MSDGSDDSEQARDPATRSWDEQEFLDETYTEPEQTQPFDDIEPEIPEPPSPEDADPQLRAKFWSLVVVFNIAILTISIGGMLLVFRNNVEGGTQLILAGVIVTGYGIYRYRQTKRSLTTDQNG